VLSESFVCNQCPPILVMLGIVLVCMAALVGYLLHRRDKSKNNVDMTFQVFSKISISTFQVNSLALAYAFDWSAAMESFLASEQAVTSVGVGYLSCSFYGDRSAGSAFLKETLIYLFAPLVLALIIFVAKRFTPQILWARYAWLDGQSPRPRRHPYCPGRKQRMLCELKCRHLLIIMAFYFLGINPRLRSVSDAA
jgi:hypothetical protein